MAGPCFRSVNGHSSCFPLFHCAKVSRGCWVTSLSEWVMRVVVCMHFASGKRTGQPAALGAFFLGGGFGGLADGLVEEVGIAEEARAPFGRAGCEGYTLQH